MGGSKSTVDGVCNNEIKRCLFIRRKAMINLNILKHINLSILKSRDMTLLTKFYLVKVMVFAVVMYGCESWTIKKAERRRIDGLAMAPHCSTLAWKIPWTEEPGRLQSMGLRRVGYD